MGSLPPPLAVPERGLLARVASATAAAVLSIALVSGLVGTQLAALTAREQIERRASLLAVMTRARLAEAPTDAWAALVRRTMARTGGIVTVVGPDGLALDSAPVSPVTPRDPLLVPEHAREEAMVDERRYFVATEALALGDVPHPVRYVVVVAVPVPGDPGDLASLLVQLTTVLLAIGTLGVLSALVVARDIATDVRAITRRALRMAAGEAAALEPLPVRARDEVGELVASFNALQRRFVDELDAHRDALARLEDAERRKEVLIATLRHELRTPLNSIIGFADLLLSGVDGDLSEPQREDVDVVARSGRHLLHLVDDVLDLSAIASGRYDIESVPVDLVPLVNEVVREGTSAARQRDVSLRLEGAPSAFVDGDPVSLRRAVTNLVQNALEHTAREVVVTVQVEGRTATVSVRDDGPGITPHELKRLFKPFERGRVADPSRPGVGLGLAITVALLELHDGNLRAESDVGRGSTFVATLPLRPTALAQAGFE